MEILLIILRSLLFMLFALVGIACCKASGDAEADAESCFEAWMKSKQGNAVPDDPKGGTA